MNIRFQTMATPWNAPLILSFLFEGENAHEACHILSEQAPWLELAPAWTDVKGKKEEFTLLYGPPAMDIPRVGLIGLGAVGAEKPLTLQDIRFAFARAIKACQTKGLAEVALDVPSVARVTQHLAEKSIPLARVLQELALAASLSLYAYTAYKKNEKKPIDTLFLCLDEETVPTAFQYIPALVEAECAGVTLARNLANAPANALSPRAFAENAQAVAARYGFEISVLQKADLEKEGMGAFLGVAQGSHRQPYMPILRYEPVTPSCQAPLLLVGKGITFDSGGISIKPSAGMEDMKADMSGAGAVLGFFEALGKLVQAGLAPSFPIISIMPCTENMPGGSATRPGDVLHSRKGKTIEIISTDAEGRLILVDALSYGQDRFKPGIIIDIATLTGACAVALGDGAAGLFSNSETLTQNLLAAANETDERLWHLPLWEDDGLKALKSEVADIKNSGPRTGGAIHAAVFLQQFVDTKTASWAHIDMAAADQGDSPVCPKGATGFGVRTLLRFVQEKV